MKSDIKYSILYFPTHHTNHNVPNASGHTDYNVPKASGYTTVAKVFMIIGTVFSALWTFLIGLTWCLPLTIIYFKKVNNGEPISVGFKVCSLLFVSLLGGIFMLCDKNE